MPIIVECTWGIGSDVIVEFKDKPFILYDAPRNPMPPKGSFTHGFVPAGSFDLTAMEAKKLAHELMLAAELAEALDKAADKSMEIMYKFYNKRESLKYK